MMSWLACLQRSATDKLGPPVSARAVVSYTTPRDIITASAQTVDSIHADVTAGGVGGFRIIPRMETR